MQKKKKAHVDNKIPVFLILHQGVQVCLTTMQDAIIKG